MRAAIPQSAAPVVADVGLLFAVSSLRTKADAADAIREAGGEAVYRLVHDTTLWARPPFLPNGRGFGISLA